MKTGDSLRYVTMNHNLYFISFSLTTTRIEISTNELRQPVSPGASKLTIFLGIATPYKISNTHLKEYKTQI